MNGWWIAAGIVLVLLLMFFAFYWGIKFGCMLMYAKWRGDMENNGYHFEELEDGTIRIQQMYGDHWYEQRIEGRR